MSTKHLGVSTPQPLSSTAPRSRYVGTDRAVWLITHHYGKTYGHFLRYETPRSMRIRITELETSLETLHRGETAYVMIARTIRDYERISELLEMFPTY